MLALLIGLIGALIGIVWVINNIEREERELRRIPPLVACGLDPGLTALANAPTFDEVFAEFVDEMSPTIGKSDYWGRIDAKSVTLLKDWLSPRQRAEFERDGTFVVVGQSGLGYRITNPHYSFNVHQLGPNGEIAVKHCFVPIGATAKGDIMLAQKIALETDERKAIATANHSSDRAGDPGAHHPPSLRGDFGT